MRDWHAKALRDRGHKLFDPLWKSGAMSRHDAYGELARLMGLPREKAHFSMFSRGQLNKAIKVLTPYMVDFAKRNATLHKEKTHSEVGASGRQRWGVCPGSRRLLRTLPKPRSSPSAQWGTDAHDHGEKYLRYIFEGGAKPPRIEDVEMRECVKAYVEKCVELHAKYTNNGALKARIWIEKTFTLPGMPDAYGTVDFMFYIEELRLLIVVDLKTGTGYMVNAVENEQLLYYATAAMFEEFLTVANAVLIIHQPRGMEGKTFSEWPVTGMRLYEELGQLRREIAATEDPNAPLVAGNHCQKSFCPGLGGACPEQRKAVHDMALADFGAMIPAAPYDVAKLVELFKAIPRIKASCEALSHFLHAEAYAGRVPPGLKLVDKELGDRKWKDENAAAKDLEFRITQDPTIPAPTTAELLMALFPRKFVSPAQAEKLLKKIVPGALFDYQAEGTLVKREPSGTTLVAESDPRPPARLDGTSDFAAVTQKSSKG